MYACVVVVIALDALAVVEKPKGTLPLLILLFRDYA
jgi:hypothetical protein